MSQLQPRIVDRLREVPHERRDGFADALVENHQVDVGKRRRLPPPVASQFDDSHAVPHRAEVLFIRIQGREQ